MIDLHIHSRSSDGLHPAVEVHRMAALAGLEVIALADHDTLAGYDALVAAGATTGPTVVPAVEFTTGHGKREIHILGYFRDSIAPAIREFLAMAGLERRERFQEGVQKLRGLGVDIEFDQVARLAEGVIGRSHVARALVERGTVGSTQQAFSRYLTAELEIIPNTRITPAQVLGLLTSQGGIAVWAHPEFDLFDSLIEEFRTLGLAGIEVYTPRVHGVEKIYLERAASGLGLVASGGSDWHGFPSQGGFGRFRVLPHQIAPFLVRLGIDPAALARPGISPPPASR